MTLPIIYGSHGMEHKNKLLADSGRRFYDMQSKLKDKFTIWIPEDHQDREKFSQQKIDLDALIKCDILVVDFYHVGRVIDGEPVWGLGTNQEVGFIKRQNADIRNKYVPIIQIIRLGQDKHPFMLEGTRENYGVTKNVFSLDECCEYLTINYSIKE